jgi:hypothetical protein
MNRRALSIPEIGIIAGTRAAFGAGVALLLADQMSKEQRRAVGWTLLAVGAISTIPIAVQLFAHHDESESRGVGAIGRFAKEYV